MWTDRSDYTQLAKAKISRAQIEQPDLDWSELLQSWHETGIVEIKAAVDPVLIDSFVNEIDELKKAPAPHIKVTGPNFQNGVPFTPDKIKLEESPRIVDYYYYSEKARQILASPKILDFLQFVFESNPILTQTLNFELGSQQAMHQDFAYVIYTAPLMFSGVWIALEDIQPGTGELHYYPGSHRWPDRLFNGRFKHFDVERDSESEHQSWLKWIHEEAERRNTPAQTFLPKKGDVLFWHGGVAHGGTQVTKNNASRRSLVAHYCSAHTRPLYHFYKPANRRIYTDGKLNYTTGYYN